MAHPESCRLAAPEPQPDVSTPDAHYVSERASLLELRLRKLSATLKAPLPATSLQTSGIEVDQSMTRFRAAVAYNVSYSMNVVSSRLENICQVGFTFSTLFSLREAASISDAALQSFGRQGIMDIVYPYARQIVNDVITRMCIPEPILGAAEGINSQAQRKLMSYGVCRGLQVVDLRLRELHAELKTARTPGPLTIMSFSVMPSMGHLGTAVLYNAKYHINIGANERVVGEISFALSLLVDLKDSTGMDQDALIAIGRREVIDLLHPHVRETLHSTTARMGIPPLLIDIKADMAA
jgi:preprotein translocase subunit SecB